MRTSKWGRGRGRVRRRRITKKNKKSLHRNRQFRGGKEPMIEGIKYFLKKDPLIPKEGALYSSQAIYRNNIFEGIMKDTDIDLKEIQYQPVDASKTPSHVVKFELKDYVLPAEKEALKEDSTM